MTGLHDKEDDECVRRRGYKRPLETDIGVSSGSNSISEQKSKSNGITHLKDNGGDNNGNNNDNNYNDDNISPKQDVLYGDTHTVSSLGKGDKDFVPATSSNTDLPTPDESSASYDRLLPKGIELKWNAEQTRAVLHVLEDAVVANTEGNNHIREFRVCLVGRARVSVLEGSAEILGHAMTAQLKDRGESESESERETSEERTPTGIVATSPFWSSWTTIIAERRDLPCRIALECIRGPQSFRVMPPSRPVVIPSTWKACVDEICSSIGSGSGSGSYGCERKHHNGNHDSSIEDCHIGDPYFHQNSISNINHNDTHRRVCMITGAKGVGKSTLLRYTTNRLLSSLANDVHGHYHRAIAILDTDVGQPELAPPGLLRLAIVRKPLLWPPYWNLVSGGGSNDAAHDWQQGTSSCYGPQSQPPKQVHCDDESDYDSEDNDDDENSGGFQVLSSVFFGATSSKADPARFIKGVRHLIEKYETEILPLNIPLLVNTDGWVKGMGYQILTTLIDHLRPTHLVQILGETKGHAFDLSHTVAHAVVDECDSSSLPPPKLYQLPACQSLPGASLCKIPAVTMRNFRWATYFLPRQLQTFDAWDFASARLLQTGWVLAANSDRTTTVPSWWSSLPSLLAQNDGSHGDDTIGYTNDEAGNSNTSTEPSNDHGALADECRLARALARERPYCVPMESVDAFIIGSDYEDFLNTTSDSNTNYTEESFAEQHMQTNHRIFQALNGRIVALCTDKSSMESLGYGILRSIDWDKRLLYVLVPPSIPPFSLHQVKALVGGHLPLPLAMLYRGAYGESFPYLTNTLSQEGVLGSEPMKSRNNIARKGLTNAGKVAT